MVRRSPSAAACAHPVRPVELIPRTRYLVEELDLADAERDQVGQPSIAAVNSAPIWVDEPGVAPEPEATAAR